MSAGPEADEFSQIAGSTSPPPPSLNTPPRIRSPVTVADMFAATVRPGEPVLAASIAVSLDGSKVLVPAPAPTNDSCSLVDTASVNTPGPI